MKKALILLILLLCGCSKKEVVINEPNKVNLNDLVIEEKKIDDLVFKNTSIIYDKGISTFKTTLINNGNNKEIKNIYIDCYSMNGLKILTLKKEINKIINNNEKFQIVIATDIDLTDIYEIKYILD